MMLTKEELSYINSFYEKDGDMEIIKIDKKEKQCIVSIPVFDGQDDSSDGHKKITFPIDYNYDGEDVYVYNTPKILDDNDVIRLTEELFEIYAENNSN